MKYLVIVALFFVAACSKSDKDALESPMGVWYVNGVAHAPDTIFSTGIAGVQARDSDIYYVTINFHQPPSANRADTISSIVYPGRASIYLQDGNMSYSSTNTVKVITTTFDNGRIIYNIPEVDLTSSTGETARLSGTIVDDIQ